MKNKLFSDLLLAQKLKPFTYHLMSFTIFIDRIRAFINEQENMNFGILSRWK